MPEPNINAPTTLSSVFNGIGWHPHLDLADLQVSYKYILAAGPDPYFTDGKTSHEYRAARFTSPLEKYNIDVNVQGLLNIYEKSITMKLELKRHAIDLVRALKDERKRIAIVSEGPHDAQERAISTLDLGPYIDHLETSNRSGIAKSDGLFEKVAEDLGVSKEEVLVIRDSEDRDVQPAARFGIKAVWVGEF